MGLCAHLYYNIYLSMLVMWVKNKNKFILRVGGFHNPSQNCLRTCQHVILEESRGYKMQIILPPWADQKYCTSEILTFQATNKRLLHSQSAALNTICAVYKLFLLNVLWQTRLLLIHFTKILYNCHEKNKIKCSTSFNLSMYCQYCTEENIHSSLLMIKITAHFFNELCFKVWVSI